MKCLSKYFLILLIGLFLSPKLNGQDFQYHFKGFVKSDFFRDSRQIASARQGHFLLYPLNAKADLNGKDINAVSCVHILPIQTRLSFIIKEKEILGASATAKVEGAFFGSTESNINSFRLRHAYVKLQWKYSNILVGQYWHPMFITSNYPGSVSFNTGAPFTPFSRNPQIRYTYRIKDVEMSLTAFSQLDFKSSGPNGAQPSYAIHAKYPALNARIIYHPTIGNLKINTGISLNHKNIKPTLITEAGYADDTYFNTSAATVFLGIKNSKLGINFQGTYGEDLYNLTMLGGYSVKSMTDDVTKIKEYTANRTLAFWTDIHNINPTHQLGLLLGYSQNEGSTDNHISTLYGRGENIDYVYRISPRYAFKKGNFKIATEFEYTVAAYGTPNNLGKVNNSKEYGNLRLLVALYYLFDVKLK